MTAKKDNMANTGTGLGFIERLLGLVSKYKVWDFLKAFAVLFMIAVGSFMIANPDWLFERYDRWQEARHEERMDTRRDNSTRINLLLDKALYRMESSRIVVLELHNGTTGTNGLPFAKCSATYEVVNDGIPPVSDQYQEVNLSLYPFTDYLRTNGYWYGRTESLKSIDKSLYYKMMSNGAEEFAGCLVEGIDEPLAFLFVTYDSPGGRDSTEIRQNVRHMAMELAVMLETQKQ